VPSPAVRWRVAAAAWRAQTAATAVAFRMHGREKEKDDEYLFFFKRRWINENLKLPGLWPVLHVPAAAAAACDHRI